MIIQLYIQGEQVELFKDESVTITDSIQNVKDIEKVFTAFSKSFSIPASKVNNKIFKHYYNFDIVGGFDARKKVSATIELNNLPFRTGKVKLEGVDLKNNKPTDYRIVFFGDIVDLKDKLGEKKLSDLNLSEYDLSYDLNTIASKLTLSESNTNNIIAPLITHSQRLYYDSITHVRSSGNLFSHTGTGDHLHGVYYDELKYAIRVNKIIEAIEDTFDLSFSSDFFKNTSKKEFNNLFMWLHRKSGKVENLSDFAEVTNRVIQWTNQENFPFQITGGVGGGYFDINTNTGNILATSLTVTPDTDYLTQEYSVSITKDGDEIYNSGTVTGQLIYDLYDDENVEGNSSYEVYITTEGVMEISYVRWYAQAQIGSNPTVTVTYDTSSFSTSATFVFQVNRQIPDIKVLDFLTGLFKLFNLTAYVENDVIQVKPLDDFFENPDTYDITEFIDVNSSNVDASLPYKEVVFKFKDTKTFLANKYGELENKTWGETFYNDNNKDLDGSLYKVETPFGHMLFERLNDESNGTQKNIQWGYSVDKSQNAYLGSPLLFYPINVETGGISMITDYDIDNDGNKRATQKTEINYVNLPFNSPELLASTNAFQLNFKDEINEWTRDTTFNKTLFTEYYRDYITSVFNPKQRLTKVKAYLPMKILLNYSLGDRFVIAGNQYKINSVSTNLATGESNIELINDL